MATQHLVFWWSIFHLSMGNLNPLSDGWTPLPYDSCAFGGTAPGQVEVVGSGSQGITCNFKDIVADYMPALWRNKYLLAVSQDLYNGFHTQDDFKLDCDIFDQTENVTEDNCGSICGWCFLINGPLGSAIFIANEIADINAVQANGVGINLHIDDDTIGEVRSGMGVGYNIDYKKVPCPGTEAGIYIYSKQYNVNAAYLNAFEFTPINYRIGVKAMYGRHGKGATDRKWYRLPRTWTNIYKWESYGHYSDNAGITCCPYWQPQKTTIYSDSTNSTFDIKIVSVLNEEIICNDLTFQAVQFEVQQCLNVIGGSVQQFTDNGYIFEDVTCDNKTLNPTQNPTKIPSQNPTNIPSKNPTESSVTDNPTESSINPTKSPTESPVDTHGDSGYAQIWSINIAVFVVFGSFLSVIFII